MKRQGNLRALRVILPFALVLMLSNTMLIAQDDPAICPWQRGDLHKMHWAQPPDEGFTGVGVSIAQTILADDFQCTSAGPFRCIHIWGSFLDDILPKKGPGSLTLELSIHANVPGEADTWSRPGTVLWSQVFKPGEYTATQVHDGPQDWCDPIHNQYLTANHRETYQYDFTVERDPFVGQPGAIYWLAVKELSASMSYTLGWKTTARQFRWNGDAVYFHPDDAGWFKMTYPQGHKYTNEALDLAFVVADSEESLPQYDLGDAPDSSNDVPGTSMIAYADGTIANFPTAYHAGSPPYGPVHRYPRDSLYLGGWVSLEREADVGVDEDSVNNLDPQSNMANRDGGDDGLQLPVVMPRCEWTTLTYTVTVAGEGTKQPYVNVWCDWNRDGDWNDRIPCTDGNDIPEWAVQNQQPVLAGPGTYTITTPPLRCWHPDGDTIDPIWLRITIAEQPWPPTDGGGCGGAGPDGGYMYGETEDYYIRPLAQPRPVEYDWGDAPDSAATAGYPTLAIHDGARHAVAGPWLGDGNGQPDTEADGQPHPKALSDNSRGINDERGVSIPPLVQGQLAAATIEVNGGGGVVQAWIDFDSNDVWQEEEKICDRFLPDGIHAIPFTVPDNAVPGATFARFRISRSGGLSPFGAALDGEVEDHYVWIDEALDVKSWCQRPDTTPQGMSIHVDRSGDVPRAMADDFQCRMRGRLTHVRLWGSWKDDRRGVIARIRLRIHPDDPVGPAGWDKTNRYSKPRPEILWQAEYIPDQFEETLYHTAAIGGLWWRDCVTAEAAPSCGNRIWQIDVDVDPNDAFQQEGLPTAPKAYWLAVEVETINGQFGWSTRQWPEHFAGDAVWATGGKLPLSWHESFYPHGHACYDVERNSVDMAFCLLFDGERLARVTCSPTTPTECPTTETMCPAIVTRCPAAGTTCPSGGLPIPTQFPVTETSCPAVETQCPPMQTVCPAAQTQCQTMATQCPAQQTLCPPSQTQCPVLATACPAAETQCPTWPTQCPPSATTCPVAVTACQSVQTVCPVVQTSCPMVVTQCQMIPSMCPTVQTVCPATQTACPFIITECPPMSTCCPHAQMQSPGATVEWSTALLGAACPTVEAGCPTVGRYLTSASVSN